VYLYHKWFSSRDKSQAQGLDDQKQKV
jgi:hypothetical protein